MKTQQLQSILAFLLPYPLGGGETIRFHHVTRVPEIEETIQRKQYAARAGTERYGKGRADFRASPYPVYYQDSRLQDYHPWKVLWNNTARALGHPSLPCCLCPRSFRCNSTVSRDSGTGMGVVVSTSVLAPHGLAQQLQNLWLACPGVCWPGWLLETWNTFQYGTEVLQRYGLTMN